MSTSASYVGDGVTTLFNVTFEFEEASSIFVEVDGVNASFTWSGPSQVQISPAPATGVPVVVYRRTDIAEASNTFADAQVLTADSLNDALTQVRHSQQELWDEADIRQNASLRANRGEILGLIPNKADRAGKVLGFNSEGDPITDIYTAIKGDPGGNVEAIGPYTAIVSPDIPAGTKLVATSGYSSDGDGGRAVFAAMPEPALGPKFQDASGRWFGLADKSPSSLHFGVGVPGATPAQNRSRLQAFFDYIAANRCEEPRVEGGFSIDAGVSLTLNSDLTSTLRWSADITAAAAMDVMLTVSAVGRFNRIYGTVSLNGGNQTDYALRQVQTAVSISGATRLIVDAWNLRYFKHSGVMGLSGSNNSMTSLGKVYGAYIGSGSPLSASFSLSANWSARVDSGATGNNNQRSVITVDALPDLYADAHVSPKQVIINGRAHYIYSVDRTASTLTIYPWIDPAVASGTLTYLMGAVVTIDGSDNNIWGIDAIDASKVGSVLVSNGLYGPNVGRIQASGHGAVLVIGGSPSDAHDGLNVADFYVEGNGTFNVVRLTSAVSKVNLLNTQGVGSDLTKFEIIAPWLTATNSRYANVEHLESFVIRGAYGQQEFYKNLFTSSSLAVYLDRPNLRGQVWKKDSWTLALQTPNTGARKFLGYDVNLVTFVGTGANGAPTGTFTIDPPAGHSVNGGAVDANVLFSGFKGPVTFVIQYDGGTAWTVFPLGGAARGAAVADPSAITYAAPAGGTTIDAQARASLAQSAADVASLRTQLVALLASLKNAGVIS